MNAPDGSVLKTAGRLLALGRPYRRLWWAALACMVMLAVTNGALAFLTGPALRYLLGGGEISGLPPDFTRVLGQVDPVWALPAAIVAIGLLKELGYLGHFYWMGVYGQQLVASVRRMVFARLSELSPRQLGQQRQGDLVARFATDASAIEVAATYGLTSYARDGLQLIVLGGVAFYQDWRIAAVLLVLMPLAVLPAARLTRVLLGRLREGLGALGLMAAQVHEGVAAIRTLQAFNAHHLEAARFDETSARQHRAMVRAGWTRGLAGGVTELLGALILASLLGLLTRAASIEPTALVSLLAAMVLMYQPAKGMARVTQLMVHATAALDRIDELMALAPAVRETSAPAKLAHPSTRVCVEQVTFNYGDRVALSGLTLDLRAGEVTALVGPSGGGKSTLVNLLLRFEDPLSGRVLLDGRDAREVGLADWRAQFALVTQEPFLLAGTIEENLRLARPSAGHAELESACRVAQAHEFIAALPDGYQTSIGERGVRLSGGQRQRLCLARAVLSSAPVLLLDEATSNLDPASERDVQMAMARVLVGKTALVIAHRLATVVSANTIHVLSGGRVVESGRHESLVGQGGHYARLWALQATGQAEAPL